MTTIEVITKCLLNQFDNAVLATGRAILVFPGTVNSYTSREFHPIFPMFLDRNR